MNAEQELLIEEALLDDDDTSSDRMSRTLRKVEERLNINSGMYLCSEVFEASKSILCWCWFWVLVFCCVYLRYILCTSIQIIVVGIYVAYVRT